jgi:hypothetical protein
MARALHSIAEIAAMLAARVEALVRELLPGGRREGREWVCGDLSGRPGRGVSVCLTGPKAGVWADFQSGVSGDLVELISHARFRGDRVAALRFARAWLGIGHAPPAGVAPPPRDMAAEAARQAERAERRRGKGLALWLAGQPIPGTPADAYLAGRGIRLADLGRAPGALRFHPAVWCAERAGEHPAMLAAIQQGGEFIGVHRTYLAPRPGGGWGKAPIRAPKKVLGQHAGGCIPLWRGASGRPLREAPEGDTVAIAEGIEDALTIALHCPDWRVIACISAGNLGGVALPPAIGTVVLCCDRDGENPGVLAARGKAIARYRAEGRSVREALPPEGFKDFNDWHIREGQAA